MSAVKQSGCLTRPTGTSACHLRLCNLRRIQVAPRSNDSSTISRGPRLPPPLLVHERRGARLGPRRLRGTAADRRVQLPPVSENEAWICGSDRSPALTSMVTRSPATHVDRVHGVVAGRIAAEDRAGDAGRRPVHVDGHPGGIAAGDGLADAEVADGAADRERRAGVARVRLLPAGADCQVARGEVGDRVVRRDEDHDDEDAARAGRAGRAGGAGRTVVAGRAGGAGRRRSGPVAPGRPSGRPVRRRRSRRWPRRRRLRRSRRSHRSRPSHPRHRSRRSRPSAPSSARMAHSPGLVSGSLFRLSSTRLR